MASARGSAFSLKIRRNFTVRNFRQGGYVLALGVCLSVCYQDKSKKLSTNFGESLDECMGCAISSS